IPSSEEIAVEELYGSWLKELHEELSVNIIIPPLDPMGLSPGLFRQNISIERRTLISDYLYNLYRDQMSDDHKITILSTGDGSIQALELAKKYSVSDKIILLSPVHNNQSISGGTIFHKLSGVPLVHYLIPWLPDSYGSHRMASYDILNDKLNEDFQNLYGKNYPRYINMYYRRDLKKQIDFLSNSLEEIKKNRFFIIYGDDDQSYSLEGFERLGDQLTQGGSEVSIMRIPQSGRLILFDNGRERVLDLISILLQ
ncbi:MAG: hypothetical protein JEY91_07525, partial [Spirochaetaceae bacterium]|nr:hypothetical protein [Spirochaetaceae bacterium]